MYLLILQDGAQKQERHNDKDVSANAHLVQLNAKRRERKLGLSLPASEALYDLLRSTLMLSKGTKIDYGIVGLLGLLVE